MAFRPDRWMTLHIFNRKEQPLPLMPILMYHSISDKKESCHPYFQTVTRPDIFKAHLRYLKENGFRVISLDQAGRIFDDQKPIPEKTLVITFDDGFMDFYTVAAPMLSSFGFTATVFLPTDYIDERRRSFKGTPCMTWEEVRTLKRDGFSFGSHTMSHPSLIKMEREHVQREIERSKAVIESELSIKISTFSYPFAFPDHDESFKAFFEKCLSGAGYQIGVTTRLGAADKKDFPFLLKRIPVNSCDDESLFSAKLKGAYDWLYDVQLLFKKGKSLVHQVRRR